MNVSASSRLLSSLLSHSPEAAWRLELGLGWGGGALGLRLSFFCSWEDGLASAKATFVPFSLASLGHSTGTKYIQLILSFREVG